MESALTIENLEEEINEAEGLTPDEAAARARSYEFKGKPIDPLTKTMEGALSRMGATIANPGKMANFADELAETQTYPDMFQDAVFCVWLCHQKLRTVLRATRKPEEAAQQAWAWWEKEGDHIGGPIYMEIIQLLGEMIEDIYSVQAETESSGGGSSQSLGES